MTRPFPRTKVLFIGGEGRSGSTVLERLLATDPQTCAVGEAKYLFKRGIGSGELCGCGRPVPECELWSVVGDRLCGGWGSAEGTELVRFFTALDSQKNIPAAVLGRGPHVRRARAVLSELYPLIAEVSGCEVIIDSSKHPAWAYLLAGTDTVDLRVIHLVRHPSGVVQSWSRSVKRPQADQGSGDRLMAAQSPVEVAFRWDVFNRLYHRLGRRSVPTVLVRYEDYVNDLEGTLRACFGLFGLPYLSTPDAMANGHGIAGNPSRFARGDEKITQDDRWVTELGGRTHRIVSALTWRTRSAYGYSSSRSSPVRPMVRHAQGRIVESVPDTDMAQPTATDGAGSRSASPAGQADAGQADSSS